MSSDAPERPRKTLSLKPRPAAGSRNPRDDSPRKRSGARAHAVARAERTAPEAQEMPPRDDSRAPRAPRGNTGGPERRSGPRPEHRSGARPEHRSGVKPEHRSGARPEHRSGARPEHRSGAVPEHRGSSAPARDTSQTELRYQRNAPSRHARAEGPRPKPLHQHTAAVAAPPGADEHAVDVAAQHAQASETEHFSVFAPCPQGLEEALAAELVALGFDSAKPGRAGASFSTDWVGIQRANLYSRLATRILVQVAHAPMHADDDVLELARATPWERWFGPEHTLRVDTSAIRSPVQSLQYCNLRVKDGICDRLREYEGARPSIDTVRPDARVHLFLFEQTATLYLDTSGESLFKRGWRLDKGEAPLRENLAAGMLALAGWDPEQALMDPFCGSGTLLIEAAWIALGIPPGIARPLGFERLRGHDAQAWESVKEEAYSRIAPGLDAPIIGYDIDPAAIEFCERNAERAWLAEDAIRFEVRDARQAERVAETGWIVTNPPYGDRLENSDPELWQDWSGTLKHQFAGWNLHVITSDLEFPQQLRLKPRRRTPLYNGGIECRLFGFELVEAGFRKP